MVSQQIEEEKIKDSIYWVPSTANRVKAKGFFLSASVGVCMMLTHCTCRDGGQKGKVRGKIRKIKQNHKV